MFNFVNLGRYTAVAATFAAALATAPHAEATDLNMADEALLEEQMADYRRDRTRTMREFQPFRREARAEAADGTAVVLTALNPHFNTWFLLDVTTQGRYKRTETYHIELADPENVSLSLVGGAEPALVFEDTGVTFRCVPWSVRSSALTKARSSDLPYVPICDKRAFLRNETRGSRSSREAVAEFLRDNVVFGESIVGLIKGSFYEDAYMSSGDVVAGADPGAIAAALGSAKLRSQPVLRTYFGFEVEGAEGGMQAGAWYAVKDAPGIFASAMQPGMIHPDILNRRGETHGLDGVESRADVYLVAFDLSQFDLGYEVGTDHPRLDWSPRPSGSGKNWNLPGPDGFNSSGDIVRTGMLSPALTDRVAATFAAGFKRDHGAWRASEKAFTRHGHHYGFLQNGVIFSRLHPGLSTIYVLDDGSIGMRTWTEADEALLPRLKFARQNGVPLIEDGVPGEMVTSWLGGNWSGSAEADLRTLRGGACVKTVEGRQFLIYAYFSTVTPSGMARTFQAYECEYAMLLDMNSQEHTYMALYTREEGRVLPHHLVSGMKAIDSTTSDGWPIPRFVGFADNRDFIYLLRK